MSGTSVSDAAAVRASLSRLRARVSSHTRESMRWPRMAPRTPGALARPCATPTTWGMETRSSSAMPRIRSLDRAVDRVAGGVVVAGGDVADRLGRPERLALLAGQVERGRGSRTTTRGSGCRPRRTARSARAASASAPRDRRLGEQRVAGAGGLERGRRVQEAVLRAEAYGELAHQLLAADLVADRGQAADQLDQRDPVVLVVGGGRVDHRLERVPPGEGHGHRVLEVVQQQPGGLGADLVLDPEPGHEPGVRDPHLAQPEPGGQLVLELTRRDRRGR